MDNSSDAKAVKAAARAAKKQNAGPDDTLQISRMLVRAIWAQEWSATNPDAGAEARKAAWLEVREAVMAAKLKPYRKALSIMGKMGVAMAVTPKAEGDAANDEADSED